MKKLFAMTVLSLVVVVPILATENPIAPTIPDRCNVVFLTDDLPNVLDGLEKSGFGRMWRDPELKDLWDPIRKEFDIEQWNERVLGATGMTLEEFKQMFTGPIGLGISFDFKKLEADSSEVPQIIFAAHVAGKETQAEEAFEKMVQKDNENSEGVTYREVTEEFKGQTIRLHEKVLDDNIELDVAWSIANGRFFLSNDKALIQETLALTIDPAASKSFASHPSVKKAKAAMNHGDVMLIVDMQSLLPGIQFLCQKAAEAGTGAQVGINMATLPQALGLDALESVALNLSLTPNATLVDFGVFFTEKKGLLKLMAYAPGSYPQPKFVPAHALSVSSSNFSFPDMWAAAEEMLNALSPALLQMATAQYQQFLQAAGVDEAVDLKKNLLQNLGHEWVSFSLPIEEDSDPAQRAMGNPTVMAVSLQDPAGFQVGLDELTMILTSISKVNPQIAFTFGETDYRNTKIRDIGLAGLGEFKVYYAVHDATFLMSIGSYSAITQALLAMANPKSSIWEQEAFKKAVHGLPPGAASMAYMDFGRIIESLHQQVQAEQTKRIQEYPPDEEPEAEIPDFSRLMAYFGGAVVGWYEQPGSFIIKGRVDQPK